MNQDLEVSTKKAQAERDAAVADAAKVRVLEEKYNVVKWEVLEKDKAIAELQKKLSDQADELGRGRITTVEEFRASTQYRREKRAERREGYSKGVARNMTVLRHLQLLEIPEYKRHLKAPEFKVNMPVDPYEATIYDMEEEEEELEDGKIPRRTPAP